jgi:hypothetical protein
VKEAEIPTLYKEDFGPSFSEIKPQNRRDMSDLIDKIISGLSVRDAEAKQDRIQVKLKRWTFQGTLPEFVDFSARLSRPFDVDGVQRRIFNVQQGEERRAIWPITGGAGTRRYLTPPRTPLFAGRLRGYRQQSAESHATKTWHLIAELSLNPTRAILHEGALHDLSSSLVADEEKLAIPATLFARERPPLGVILPFVTGDNFATGSQRFMSLFWGSNWRINVRRYWEGIVRLLDETLETAAEEAGGSIYKVDQKLTLNAIETYWEFGDIDPVATVAALERPFRALGSKSSVEWYTFPDAARRALRGRSVILADDDNAPVIKMQVAKGVQIKAYAKTSERVRFEVTHTQGAADIGPYTAADTDGLYRWIERAAGGAALRMSHLLDALANALSEPSGFQYQPQRLLYDLYEACKDWPSALRTLGILINTGKIEARKSSPLGDVVKKLIRKKIIRRVSPKNAEVRIFHVTERYRAALSSFQRDGVS